MTEFQERKSVFQYFSFFGLSVIIKIVQTMRAILHISIGEEWEIRMKVGDRLVLEKKGAGTVEKYKSKILEMTRGSIFIDYPLNTKTNKTAFLVDGTKLKATYVGQEDVAYYFSTEVIGKRKAAIPLIQLSCPPEDQHQKIQRREYVRIETNVDAAVHSANHEFLPFTTVSEDISAGGAALLVPKQVQVKENSMVSVWMALPARTGEINYVKVESQVVRLIDRPQGNHRIMTLQFHDLSDKERQQLIRFCFEKQLEQRKTRD